MPITDYTVRSDKFEFEEEGVLSFPCCVCKWRPIPVDMPPCSQCGHNLSATDLED